MCDENKLKLIKNEFWGTDVMYAIENFDGLLWDSHDADLVEQFMDISDKCDNEALRQMKDGLEINICEWLMGCVRNHDAQKKTVCGTDVEIGCLYDYLSDDNTNGFCKITDMIVEDIVKFLGK